MSHTVISVGIVNDNLWLVSVNDRYGFGVLDNTQTLQDLLASDYPQALYVGPRGLLPAGLPKWVYAHAEDYVLMYAVRNDLDLEGIGASFRTGLCSSCSARVYAIFPHLIPGLVGQAP